MQRKSFSLYFNGQLFTGKMIQICRTCLSKKRQGKCFSIDEENGLIKNVNNIREMLAFCEPEMDLYVSVDPVICESCIPNLIAAYNFKLKCIKVENIIRAYLSRNKSAEGHANIDLRDLIPFKCNPITKGNVKNQIAEFISPKPLQQSFRMQQVSRKRRAEVNVTDDVIVIDDANYKGKKFPVQNGTIDKPHYSKIGEVTVRPVIPEVIILDDKEAEVTNIENVSLIKESYKSATETALASITDITRSRPRAKKLKALNKVKRVRTSRRVRRASTPKTKPTEELGILESVGLQAKNSNVSSLINCNSLKDNNRKENIRERQLFVKLPRVTFLDCRLCSYTCITEDDLNDHHRRHHPGNSMFCLCYLCSFKTEHVREFRKHYRKFHKEECATRLKDLKILPTYYCTLCKFTSQSHNEFVYHRKYVHYVNIKGSYKCPHCQDDFYFFRELHKHVELRHSSGTVVYECVFCNFQCLTKHRINVHYNLHSKTKLKCLLCPAFRTFNQEKFSAHMREMHSAQRYTGMAFLDATVSANDDYIIRLDELAAEKDQHTSQASIEISRAEQPTENNLLNGPSLSDLLSSWMMRKTEEMDCTIVEPEINPETDDDCVLMEASIEVIDLDSDNENDLLTGGPGSKNSLTDNEKDRTDNEIARENAVGSSEERTSDNDNVSSAVVI